MAYRKKPKKPTIKQLKKKAPKVPDLTCPMIDHAINHVENTWDGKKYYSLTKRELNYFKKRMEEIRSANDGLRDSGRYWYEKTRDIIDPDSNLDYER